jgi:hypothetical protein
MVDQFVFEAAPERLDKGVIVAVALAAHRSEQTVLGQHLAVSRAGELGATIRVDDEWASGPTLAEGHAEGGDDQRGIEDLAHGPADHPPRVKTSRTATRYNQPWPVSMQVASGWPRFDPAVARRGVVDDWAQ